MTVRELDRPLRFGDLKQIAVVRAMEAGAVACRCCGVLMDPASWENDGFEAPALCTRCAGGGGMPLKETTR